LPPGVASSHFHDHVQVGDIIDTKAPAGQFVLSPDLLIPTVMIAGGVGITPMISMVQYSLNRHPGRSIHLFYGVRNGMEHAFKDTLKTLSASNPDFHVTVIYSDPDLEDMPDRDFQHTGYISLDLLRRTLPLGRHEFYVCGPPPMMASLLPGLRAWGVAVADIHFEAFGPASARSALDASSVGKPILLHPIEVTFRRSGRTLSWDGQDSNLLDFAERHGIAVDSGCRSGSCGSCETRLNAGVVRYAHKPDHAISDGSCLLCVGVPDSALLLEG
jgi:ferredoxin-NADP reductase